MQRVLITPYNVALDLRAGSLRVRYQVYLDHEKFSGAVGSNEVMLGDSPGLQKAVADLVAAITLQLNQAVGLALPEGDAAEPKTPQANFDEDDL